MKTSVTLALVVVGSATGFLIAQVSGASNQAPRVTMVKAKGNFDLEEARRFSKFPLYYSGDSVLGLPLVAIHRVDAKPYPGETVREDNVTFLYGLCRSIDGSGCAPPIQIQVWDACERYQALYPFSPDESLIVRGIPAAFYERQTRLELYSGEVTIVLFGRDPEQLLNAARMLKGVNRRLGETENLPEPRAGVRDGALECQQS